MTGEREPSADRVTDSRLIYEGRKVRLRLDSIELAGGRKSVREVVEHPAVAAILPLDEEGCVLMVRQYRLATGKILLEIPAGVVDPGETPEAAARRELAEETGTSADRLTKLCSFFVSPGVSSEMIHLFLAEGLQPASATPDDDEDIVVKHVPLSTALLMAERGEFADAKTIIAVLLSGRVTGLLH